jgi:16S rRNA (cytosine1402-N4)-methyltransferase
MRNHHTPVLLDEVVGFVFENISKPKVFDATFGGGGYTTLFLEKGAEVFATDLDRTVYERYFLSHPKNSKLHTLYGNFADVVKDFENNFFHSIVADLGFSSNQLEESGRGFSYQKLNDLLDFRYDQRNGQGLLEKLSKVGSSDNLGKILFQYSGETMSRRIASQIFNDFKDKKLTHVKDLVKSIDKVISKELWHKRNGIYSRIWQALRIWVNDEFVNLELFLRRSLDKLVPGGLLIVVCFHSLEDKIVTKFMRSVSKPLEIDNFGNTIQSFELITKKAKTPSEQEVEENIRSRSATLRILKKL